jgi:16S rRNA (cytidine1402-2'-O)-methyltransferase
MNGILYLIPTTLGDENPFLVLPYEIKPIIDTIKYFIVEDERSARRFLRKIDPGIVIDDLTFYVLNKRTRFDEMVLFLTPVFKGNNVGIVSEAGCPGVADPGAEIVKVAHQKDIKVKRWLVPLQLSFH